MVAEENDVDFESMANSGGDVDFAEDIDFEVEAEAPPARRSRGSRSSRRGGDDGSSTRSARGKRSARLGERLSSASERKKAAASSQV